MLLQCLFLGQADGSPPSVCDLEFHADAFARRTRVSARQSLRRRRHTHIHRPVNPRLLCVAAVSPQHSRRRHHRPTVIVHCTIAHDDSSSLVAACPVRDNALLGPMKSAPSHHNPHRLATGSTWQFLVAPSHPVANLRVLVSDTTQVTKYLSSRLVNAAIRRWACWHRMSHLHVATYRVNVMAFGSR